MPQKRTIPRVCEQCGKPYLATAHAAKIGRTRFCSRTCIGKGSARTPKSSPGHIEEDRGHDTPCWIWQGSTKNGYAVIGHPARRVHRITYEAKYGPIPEGYEPDHLCRQKECVNPDHLEPVTHTENVRRGPHTRLDWDKVHELRRLASLGIYHQRELAAIFGITQAQIYHVIYNKQWYDPDAPAPHVLPNKGDTHAHARLTAEGAREIRQRYVRGVISMQSLANEYGVSVGTVLRVVSGRGWKDA